MSLSYATAGSGLKMLAQHHMRGTSTSVHNMFRGGVAVSAMKCNQTLHADGCYNWNGVGIKMIESLVLATAAVAAPRGQEKAGPGVRQGSGVNQWGAAANAAYRRAVDRRAALGKRAGKQQ
jgi:hypothetical protein